MHQKRNLKIKLLSLLQQEHFLSASNMLKILKERGVIFNKTSVYRALEQLLADDKVCRQYFHEDEAVYELRDHHHAHVVCEKCGRVTQTECTYSHPDSVEGYSISHHHVTLVGLCAECQSQPST